MRTHIKLGRVFGIEIGLHYSWVLIAGLIAFSLAGHFRMVHPEWGEGTLWAASILTAILFFVALVAHELAHSLVATAHGLPVRSITLFALGGVSQIEKEPADPKTEFWMAFVGPLSSAVIGAGCIGVALALGWPAWTTPATPILAVLVWLGYINFSLAVFNMIPGYPLDGGRVLRAVIWWITKNAERSTRIASQTGRAVALLFVGYGLFQFLAAASVGGLWIAVIGWFLFDAARFSYSQVKVAEMLKGVRVGDLMMRDCPNVDIRTNLRNFIEEEFRLSRRFCYIVTDNDHEVGLISPRDIQEIPRPQWPYKTLADIMRPLDEAPTISPDASIVDALERMVQEDVNQLPVSSNGHIEGVISRAAVAGFLQSRRLHS